MRLLLLSLGFLMLVAPDASATTCRKWERLADFQKADTVDQLIQQAIEGSGGRQITSISRGAVARCLRDNAQKIQYAIDDECEAGGGMDAPRVVLRVFIWSCV